MKGIVSIVKIFRMGITALYYASTSLKRLQLKIKL